MKIILCEKIYFGQGLLSLKFFKSIFTFITDEIIQLDPIKRNSVYCIYLFSKINALGGKKTPLVYQVGVGHIHF